MLCDFGRGNIFPFSKYSFVDIRNCCRAGVTARDTTFEKAPNCLDRTHVRGSGRSGEKIVSNAEFLESSKCLARAMGRGIILLEINISRCCISSLHEARPPRI